MNDKEELIWVSKEFSEKWKKLKADEATREQQETVFNQYMESVAEAARRDFKANLETLDEDAAIFTGLMLKVKQAFEKAKNEQLDASYALWEKFEAEIPSVRKKTDSIIAELKPLSIELKNINELISSINTHRIDSLRESVSAFANLQGTNKEMLEFLITNFTKKEEK